MNPNNIIQTKLNKPKIFHDKNNSDINIENAKLILDVGNIFKFLEDGNSLTLDNNVYSFDELDSTTREENGLLKTNAYSSGSYDVSMDVALTDASASAMIGLKGFYENEYAYLEGVDLEGNKINKSK